MQSTNTSLFVEKCELGSHITIKNAQAMFNNCAANDTEISGNKTLIKSLNSTVTMKNSNIEHFQGGSFIETTAGTGYIRNVKFLHCNSTVPLIMVFNRSLLSLENCSFYSNNGPQLIVENSSIATINNSMYQSNTNLHKDTNSKTYLMASGGGNLFVMNNSQFINNTFSRAAVVLADKGIAIIENSTFSDNRENNNTGVVVVARNIGVRIRRSIFSHNNGSAALLNSTNVVVSKCRFEGNVARDGAGLILASSGNSSSDAPEIKSITSLFHKRYPGFDMNDIALDKDLAPVQMTHHQTIYKCVFEGNTAGIGGAIIAVDPDVMIHSCVFMKNQATTSPGMGGAVSAVHQKSSRNKTALISVWDSTFKENNATLAGGAIHTTIKTKIHKTTVTGNSASIGGAASCSSLIMSNCHFESNKAKLKGGAVSLNRGSHYVSNTNFTLNTAVTGGAVSGWTNLNLTCSACVFHSNTAGDK